MTSEPTTRRRGLDRLAPGHAEIARFLLTGGAAYAVDLAVFNALILLADVGSLTAKVVSSVFAIAVAFAGSRWFTWRDRRSDRVVREYVLFVVFSVLAAGIQYLCLVLTHEVLGWTSPLVDNLSANVVGMALAMAFRFWTFRTYVFPPTSAPPRV
ncbi:GtrA family protein [uncultured Pseudokineococcus sp.]|uniref:GtrA family protein n=1 Tax=uncultured Pseudokineococcus sp. TaxID=1642928 RepID=UPI002609D5D1|nr:GtrA family protein [uncultured Pseudokineococcus sp.]